MQPLVSIVVPVYKVEKYLDRCVESLVRQTYSNLEIILVDDGSPDKCPGMCDEWAEKDKRIKVIHQKNGGVSAARNNGMDLATGEYLLFVDSDDYVSVKLVAKAIHRLLSEKADIVIYEHANDYGNRIEEAKFGAEYIENTEKLIEDFVWDHIPCYVWSVVVKRKLWDGVKYPICTNFEDIVAWFDVAIKASKIVLLNEVLYYYNCANINSITTYTSSLNKLGMFLAWQKRLEYAEKTNDAKLWKRASQRCTTRSVTTLGLNMYDHKLLPGYVDEIYTYLKGLSRKELSLVSCKYKIMVWLALHFPAGLNVYGYTVYFLQNCKKCYLQLFKG